MSSEPPKTEVCSDFEPQAWRKTLCVNCFHTKNEHVAGAGDKPAGKSVSNGDVKPGSKGSPAAAKDKKQTDTPSPKSTGSKFSPQTTGKTSPLSKAKQEVNTPTKTDTKTKNEHKKEPPPVSSKIPPGLVKKTPGIFSKTPGEPTKPGLSKEQTSVPDKPSSSILTKGGKTSTTNVTDDSKSKSANKTEIGKTGLTIFSNTSHKAGKTDEKPSSKVPNSPSSVETKKFGGIQDKLHKSQPDDNKPKSTTDEKPPTKQSKFSGLLKNFGTADDSSDVKGLSVKDKARSEKAESKSSTEASKTSLKDSSKSSGDQKSGSEVSKSVFGSKNLSSGSPTTARGNTSAESIKNKFGDVTSSNKQTSSLDSKDLKGKSLNSDELRSSKDASVSDSGVKSKTFTASSFSAKGRDAHGSTSSSTSSTSSDKDVVDSAKFTEVSKSLKAKETEVEKLTKKLKDMEDKVKKLTEENTALKKMAYDSKKDELEKSLSGLKSQLASVEAKCSKLHADNAELKKKAHDVSSQKDVAGRKEVSQLERDLDITETECEELKGENLELRKELSNLKIEIEEMYDTFKENEMDEFREIQKELDIASKNCRILQFKLRKSERRNELIEGEKVSFEDKLRSLQSQFTSEDARDHIRCLEDELTHAKEVQSQLNDDIDLIEDKKSKVEEENRQLTEILEQADKKQFRMEMDIDRLKDQIADLQQKVPRSNSDTDSSRDRRTLLGRIGKQSSGDQEMSQMTRDLYDSVERENDLTEQLKFTEEETKMMRRKVHELEEENERLNVQLKKLSKDSAKTTTKMQSKKEPITGKPKIVVTDPDDSDSSMTDTDTDTEDELNIVEVKLQLGLLEQELSLSHRKITDVEQQNENLQTQIKVLNEQLHHREQLLSVVPSPPSPNSYYEDKIEELTIECDGLRWKVIDRDRTIERMNTQASAKARQGKLKKTRSLDSDPHVAQINDLRKQLDIVSHEAELFKDRLSTASAEGEKLAEENTRLRLLQRVPSIQADDAAIENIELRDKNRKVEEENKNLTEKIRILTESVQTLTKTPRSPTKDPQSAFGVADVTNGSRDLQSKLERVLEENKNLRDKMADLEKLSSSNDVSGGKFKDGPPMSPKLAAVLQKAGSSAKDDARDHLMETILDLEDELDETKSKLKKKEYENIRLEGEVKSLQNQLEELKEDNELQERELMEEVEMMHDKNAVLSNLLDIVNERAETAERELDQQHSSPSERSPSAVSALSGASVGSDDVFLVPPSLGDKTPSVGKDWDSQMKKRVNSLERLLAEERQKVQTVEKKLRLANPDNTTSGMSDDVKLHLREKELLQDDLLEHQKMMRIATDQIKGFKERISIMEEENIRVRMDYGRLCEELDRRSLSDQHEKTPENVLEKSVSSSSLAAASPRLPRPRSPLSDTADIGRLKEQCAKFKLKAEELEYKVEELNEIWKAKSATSEIEKKALEEELRNQSTEMAVMKQTLETLKRDLCDKELKLTEHETTISEKDSMLNKREDFLQEQDDVLRQRDTDFQTLLEQVSQREETIRSLRENLSNRDERLKEKDEYIGKLNKSLEEKQKEVTSLGDELKDAIASVKEKEVIIAILQQQISESSVRDSGSETDIEKDNLRLKNLYKNSQIELQKSRDEKQKTLHELDKSKKALNEAMLMWEKNRTGLQTDMNILVEKLRLYEITTTMDRADIIMTLKSDAQKNYGEKEKLACEVHNLRRELDVDTRDLKEQVLSLQTELVDKCKHLKEEVEIGTRLQQEVDRLSSQAEMAYKFQQEEKILRAEYLAMKVRYETRLDKVSRDYTKMIVQTERLEKEKELDKEIIQGIQKGMSQLKENYQQDLIRWEDEKQRLEKHSKEIEDSRKLTIEMRKKLGEFKERVSEQDRLRSELITRFATQRTTNEIERANLQSRINQLKEQLILSNKAQSQAQNQNQHMDTTWEKERAEQNRLLSSAHSLALDLQQQMKDRDLEFSSARKELLNQLEADRQDLEKAKNDRERALAELEVLGKKFVNLQVKFKSLQEKNEKDQEIWLRERNELRRRVMETQLAHTRDTKRIDDILTSLIKLREVGALIASEPETTSQGEGQQSRDLQRNILKYIKESVAEITQAADQLANQTDAEIKTQFRRSLSSSELNLLKEQLSRDREVTSVLTDTLTVQTSIHRSVTHDGVTPFTSSPNFIPPPLTFQSNRLTADRNSSYSSGSRSASSSRAHTPEILERQVAGSSFHSPTPTIPTRTPSDSNNPRPKTLTKSNSLETPKTMATPTVTTSSISLTTTPTTPTPNPAQRTYKAYTRSRSDDNVLSTPAPNFNRLTPRSARRKFFETQTPPSQGFGFLSYPDYRQPLVYHQKQTSSPAGDQGDVTQTSSSSSQMKTSASVDERLHHNANTPTSSDNLDAALRPQTVPEEPELEKAHAKPQTAKDKRKFFKKSSSLDSTVGTSIAKIGMQAIPPAAPTGFTPTDIFSTLKEKLRGRKSKDYQKSTAEAGPSDKSDNSSNLPESFQDETSQHSVDDTLLLGSEDSASRSPRSLMPEGSDPKRWRSKSADRSQRVAKPVMVHSDVITPIQVWQFSETAV